MAYLRYDKSSGIYFIRFRYVGASFNRSLKTRDRREAEAIRGRVDETILLLERGRLEMPAHADPAAFILSDGKKIGKPEKPKLRTLADLFQVYEAELPTGSKEENTRLGERRHEILFKKHLGGKVVAQSLSVADLQRYVAKRSKDRWHGEPVQPTTISKELATFRLIWNWAVERGYLKGPPPTKGVRLPKGADRLPFMTREEIQRKIDRGGLSENQERRLWDSLFLAKEEIGDVLEYVRQQALRPFVYPMFVFVAHTGARRSEILRSRIDDFNFATGIVAIREKKKLKSRRITLRHVDLTPLLSETMQAWFDSHPGGQFTICDFPGEILDGKEDDEQGMSQNKAHNHFEKTLESSEWSTIRGFHVFRHSFASNLAAAGVDQRVIDEWMGHQTDEMRRRYRHLFPKQRRSAVELVFGAAGAEGRDS